METGAKIKKYFDDVWQGMSLMPTVLSRTMSRNSNVGGEESKSRSAEISFTVQ